LKMLWFACSPRAQRLLQSRLARLFCRSTSKHGLILAKYSGEGTSQGAASASSLLFIFSLFFLDFFLIAFVRHLPTLTTFAAT